MAVFEVVAAVLAELTGVPAPAMADPGNTGMEGSTMPISVTTEGFEFWYRAEFGFNNSMDSVSTLLAGM